MGSEVWTIVSLEVSVYRHPFGGRRSSAFAETLRAGQAESLENANGEKVVVDEKGTLVQLGEKLIQ